MEQHLEDLLLAVALAHLGGHHGQELLKVNGAAAVLVNVRDHLLHLLLLRLKSQRPARQCSFLEPTVLSALEPDLTLVPECQGMHDTNDQPGAWILRNRLVLHSILRPICMALAN